MPLVAPREGTPAPIETPDALAEVIDRFAAGTGPVAIDAERASGYRYSQRAYLVQLRRAGAGTALLDPLPFDADAARAYGRILRLARTIADLEGGGPIDAAHVAEAVQYRCLDRAAPPA